MTDQEAIRVIKTIRGRAIQGGIYTDALTYAIKALEAKKHGFWVTDPRAATYPYRCILCGSHHREATDFCPSCGADMTERGDDDEED